MKSLALPSVLMLTCLASIAKAQTPADTAPKPALTEAQVSTVLNQLKELESQILQMRGSNLASVMAKLRAGMASDQAAMSLYLECYKIVNSERKEVDKAEARKQLNNVERNIERNNKGGGGGNEEGDFGFAIRLGLQYILLTIEAHEAKDEDFKKMGSKLQEYIQAVVAAAPKLKGRAQVHLGSALTDRNPIVEAFNLNRFLNREKWSTRPADIGSMYTLTLIPLALENDELDSLPTLWDARINAEGIFRKESMFAPEFELWTQNELPVLRWQRATYLYEKGPSPINAMADMLKLIKENPGHADAPKWVQELRQMVNRSSPEQKSANIEPASGT